MFDLKLGKIVNQSSNTCVYTDGFGEPPYLLWFSASEELYSVVKVSADEMISIILFLMRGSKEVKKEELRKEFVGCDFILEFDNSCEESTGERFVSLIIDDKRSTFMVTFDAKHLSSLSRYLWEEF